MDFGEAIKRVKEHKYAVKSHNEKNGIAAHTWTTQHRVDWSAAKVRKRSGPSCFH